MLPTTILVFILIGGLFQVVPAKRIYPTKGSPWPLPNSFTTHGNNLLIRPSHFKFKFTSGRCSILNEATNRYSKIISTSLSELKGYEKYITNSVNSQFESKSSEYLDSLEVYFSGVCERVPNSSMVEKYRLEVNSPTSTAGKAILSSRTVWGILRGLETFSQLITPAHDGSSLMVMSASISDEPRFPHRGLLIDTSRHYLPIKTIKDILDAMEYNKMNVLHWHIVDDESFPFQSEVFPELSEFGAYDPRLFIYSIHDVKDIVDYASLRGIRVLPEFDTPGHTLSWGLGRPDLLTKCVNLEDAYGPIDPTNNANYDFIKQLFKEVVSVFSDNYLHLGGDEVDFQCWKSNPNITKFMKTHNITSYELLESYYIKVVLDIVNDDLKTSSVVWQEVFDNDVEIAPATVVHIWKNPLETELQKVTQAGFNVLVSTCWYLDHLSSGGDWNAFYQCDPLNFNGTKQQKELVLGGEACMWGEVVDETNALQRIWPRASAAAEKLWSSKTDNFNKTLVAERLAEHTCRMRRRGIPAQPSSGPAPCIF